jgi:hypothetical protein
MQKPPCPPAVDAACLAKVSALNAAFAAISHDPTITGDREEELNKSNGAHESPICFDYIALLLADDVLERAIHKPSVGSSPGPDGIPAGLLRFMWIFPAG